MAPTIVAAIIEAHLIHEASCRSRKQLLVCSTCVELRERAMRVAAHVMAVRQQIAEAA